MTSSYRTAHPEARYSRVWEPMNRRRVTVKAPLKARDIDRTMGLVLSGFARIVMLHICGSFSGGFGGLSK